MTTLVLLSLLGFAVLFLGAFDQKKLLLPVSITGMIAALLRMHSTGERTLPGISKKLNNPLQFYTDTDFVVPRDINLG